MIPETLRADCASCFGLCCVAPAFTASADFAVDKPAGTPCLHLLTDHRCAIHSTLRSDGFAGCTVFDCLGAGQRVAQQTFGGRSWRDAPETASTMFTVFGVMRHLHELLWLLAEAIDRTAGPEIAEQHPLTTLRDEIEALAGSDATRLAILEVDPLYARARPLLTRVSDRARASFPERRAHRGADLIGARLGGADLRGADLRGAYLLGADLRSADLRSADLLGADLRATDLRGADLTDVWFLTPFQLNAARGDAATRLPTTLLRPTHWSTRAGERTR